MLLPPARLRDAHRVDDFSCGVVSLDEWLKRRAAANEAAGASRCYVVADAEGRVAGYYALSAGALATVEAPGRVRRNMPDPIPMALLGRLAVDRAQQGRGLGVALLKDAVIRARDAARIMGVRGILVHAISEDAARFYRDHGFVPGVGSPMVLIFTL